MRNAVHSSDRRWLTPETVLAWVAATYNLSVGAIGERAAWSRCKGGGKRRGDVFSCPLGKGGVWHTHNASEVWDWLQKERAV